MSELLKVSDLRVRYPVAGGMAAMLNRKNAAHRHQKLLVRQACATVRLVSER